MIFKEKGRTNINSGETPVKVRCPACRQRGTLDAASQHDVRLQTEAGYFAAGQRICPDPACRAHLFFVFDQQNGRVLVTYPAETIDFDSTNLPSNILKAFEEAVKCHANQCCIASAIMVRKTLEELCKERGATGEDLKKRLDDLRSKIILPQELMDGLDDLRLLGNAAAHIESKEYDDIGHDEVEVAIEVTKEILKAVYQYATLLGKLKKFKKTP